MSFTAGAVKQIRKNKTLNSLAQRIYLGSALLRPVKARGKEELLYKSPSGDRTRVAFICDEMTWKDFSGCCDAIFLHPRIWKRQLEQFRPTVLFCESAWVGIDDFWGTWRNRVYRDRRVGFENRKLLLKILGYCDAHGIKTVYWNKEDPLFFDHPIYDFGDTARFFQYTFTTAEECVDRYRAIGAKNVYTLPFGVNTELFHSSDEKPVPGTALFAGSWYGDIPQRCADTEKLLDYALEKGWKLDIYDRKSGVDEEKSRFPAKYAPYIHPAVPFEQMPELYRRYEYAINVNTIVNSSTMISRRILQLAASGVTVVSNNSKAFAMLEDCMRIWQPEEGGPVYSVGIPEKICAHSVESRFRYVMEKIGEKS